MDIRRPARDMEIGSNLRPTLCMPWRFGADFSKLLSQFKWRHGTIAT
jgi:hypothetical protein